MIGCNIDGCDSVVAACAGRNISDVCITSSQQGTCCDNGGSGSIIFSGTGCDCVIAP